MRETDLHMCLFEVFWRFGLGENFIGLKTARCAAAADKLFPESHILRYFVIYEIGIMLLEFISMFSEMASML
ncbi:MAG: hypothetical protein JW941_06655 [Candidatus Coatesbacteria bacterium]|nr:hypothetical protein [Candidatus Coatesbacteria bacterium]